MQTQSSPLFLCLALAVGLSACGGETINGSVDGPDAGAGADATSQVDASSSDASTADSGSSDASVTDSGSADASADSGSADASTPDPITLAVTPATVGTVMEGAEQEFSVALSAAPDAAVAVSVTVEPASAGSVDTASFNLSDTTAQAVSFSASEDADTDNQAVTITFSAAGMDDVVRTFTVTDNDVQALSVTPGSLSFAEGSAGGSFTVALTQQPSAAVSVTLAASAGLSINPTGPLTFTSTDYSTAQEVTVTVAADATFEDTTGTVTVSSAGLDNATVAVTATDPDVAPVSLVVTAPDEAEGYDLSTLGLSLLSAGPATPIAIALSGNPEAARTVTIVEQQQSGGSWSTVLGLDERVLTISSASLSFSADNWNTAQQVTVRASEAPSAQRRLLISMEDQGETRTYAVGVNITAISNVATISHTLMRPLAVAGVSHTQTLSWDATNNAVGFVVKHPTQTAVQYFSVARDSLSGTLTPTLQAFSTATNEYTSAGMDFMSRWPSGASLPTVVARGGIEARDPGTATEFPQADGWVLGGSNPGHIGADLRSLVNAEDGAILYANADNSVYFQSGADAAVEVLAAGTSQVYQLSLIQRPNTTNQYTALYREGAHLICQTLTYTGSGVTLGTPVSLSATSAGANRLSEGAFYHAAALSNDRIVIASGSEGFYEWYRQTFTFDCGDITGGDDVDEAHYRRAGIPQIAVHDGQAFIVVQGSLYASSELYQGRVVGWIGSWNGTAFTDTRRVIIGTGELGSVVWAGDRWVVSYFDTDGDMQIVSGSFAASTVTSEE